MEVSDRVRWKMTDLTFSYTRLLRFADWSRERGAINLLLNESLIQLGVLSVSVTRQLQEGTAEWK